MGIASIAASITSTSGTDAKGSSNFTCTAVSSPILSFGQEPRLKVPQAVDLDAIQSPKFLSIGLAIMNNKKTN
jgi:hypothetical protein